MVIKRVLHDHGMKLWRCLVDNREIIGTGSTNPWFIQPRSPLIRLTQPQSLLMYEINLIGLCKNATICSQ